MIKTDIDTFGCLLATGKTREKKRKENILLILLLHVNLVII